MRELVHVQGGQERGKSLVTTNEFIRDTPQLRDKPWKTVLSVKLFSSSWSSLGPPRATSVRRVRGEASAETRSAPSSGRSSPTSTASTPRVSGHGKQVDVFFWGDGRGVRVEGKCRLDPQKLKHIERPISKYVSQQFWVLTHSEEEGTSRVELPELGEVRSVQSCSCAGRAHRLELFRVS